MNVAEEIFTELGGPRFLIDIRCTDPCAIDNGLRLRLRINRSHANYLEITKGEDDLYTMKFLDIHKPKWDRKNKTMIKHKVKTLREIAQIEGSNLRKVFSLITGFELT